MINKRLFNHYKIDTNKNLNLKQICARPFDTLLIDKNGSCYACECTSWLPQSIGNIKLKSIEQILDSDMLNVLRNSIKNGRYNFCNEKQCSYIKSDIFETSSATGLRYLRLALDDSCNLRCPSCRIKKIFLYKGKKFNDRLVMAKKVIDFLQSYDRPLTINIGSDGDPFSSLIYRYILKNFPKKKNLRFSLQTNGLLLEKFHKRNLTLFDQLETLNISVDGATKKTYEKIRVGGQWEQIDRNLNYISKVSRKFCVYLHMVVQENNWQELAMMAEMTDKLGFEKIYFNLIQDWGTGNNCYDTRFTKLSEFKILVDQVRKNKKARLWGLN